MMHRPATLRTSILSASLAAGLLCAATLASAQSNLSIKIPFAFSAEHQTVPAGSYKVELLTDRYLSLRNAATHKTQVLMVRPEQGQAIETRSRMVFSREGSKNYLAQIWIAGTSVHSEIAVPHKPERQLAQGPAPAASTIEVAFTK
jgi:hypothetical protein